MDIRTGPVSCIPELNPVRIVVWRDVSEASEVTFMVSGYIEITDIVLTEVCQVSMPVPHLAVTARL